MGKMRQSVNYFTNLGAVCYFPNIGCNEFSFPKRRGCECNLPLLLLIVYFMFGSFSKSQ